MELGDECILGDILVGGTDQLPVWVEQKDMELSDECILGDILVRGTDQLAVHCHTVAVPLPRVNHAWPKLKHISK